MMFACSVACLSNSSVRLQSVCGTDLCACTASVVLLHAHTCTLISLQPCTVLCKYCPSLPPPAVERHKAVLHLAGKLMAWALLHGNTLDLTLSRPLLKQVWSPAEPAQATLIQERTRTCKRRRGCNTAPSPYIYRAELLTKEVMYLLWLPAMCWCENLYSGWQYCH